MPSQQPYESWPRTAFAKISEYLEFLAEENDLPALPSANGRNGENIGDFEIFHNGEMDLRLFILVLLLSRAISKMQRDIFRAKAVTCIRTDLPLDDCFKALTILAPRGKRVKSGRYGMKDTSDSIYLCEIDCTTSTERKSEELKSLFARREPIILVLDQTGEPERLLPQCSYDVIELQPIPGEIVGIALAFEYPGLDQNALGEALHQLTEDNDLTGLSFDDLVMAFRAESALDAAKLINALLQDLDADVPIQKTASADEIAEAVVPLDEIVGLGSAKTAAQDIVLALEAYREGRLDWQDVPRGLLLVGDPGTGKTELARAMSQTAGLSFEAASYSEWQRGNHLGSFLKAMSDSFENAQAKAPCIIFIDELDGFQQALDGRNSSYDQKATKGLLEQLDGIRGREGIVVIAAANRLGAIPVSIRRAGRFDDVVNIPLPSLADLAVITRQHLRPSERDIDVETCAVHAVGKTGADCAAAIRKGRAAARRSNRPLRTEDITQALIGELMSCPEDVRFRMAVHECGHAFAANAFPELTVEYVCAYPQSAQCNVSGQLPIHTTETLHRDRIIWAAGRVAETLVCGSPSSGAGGDHRSDLGRIMFSAANEIGAYGLGQNGPLWLGASYSDNLFKVVARNHQREIAELVSRAETAAQRLLEPMVPQIVTAAEELMKSGVLAGDRLTNLLSNDKSSAPHF
ncbi:MAG: AAA family ATPase [Cognatishimia sp.]|uniref:AAA family ATPase n=1 Tax=Cognatishimia sp. TaxID=2211648 RepID=UPI003B8C44C1